MPKLISKVGLLLTLSLLLVIPSSGFARFSSAGFIESIDTTMFPSVSMTLRVFDAQGVFLHKLRSTQISVLEDSSKLTPTKIEEHKPGAQIVFALNLGQSFAIRDSNGVSRIDRIKETLLTWGKALRKTNNDDLTLITNDGIEYSHLKSAGDWLKRLTDYEPSPKKTNPTLNILSRAIDLAMDPPDQNGMGKTVILITPPPRQAALDTLQELATRASQQHVHINVMMVSSATLFDSPAAKKLEDIADQTGGKFFPFSGIEEIPDPETFIEPFRYIYQIVYPSQITTSGNHVVSLKINSGDALYESNSVSFKILILPPNPMFVSPPLEIIRTMDENQTSEENPLTSYLPKDYTLRILVEFPDSHPRPLSLTALYIDGKPVAENKKEPFDTFNWDLSPYLFSGKHSVQVKAVDSFGLTGQSIQSTVKITIKHRPRDILITIRNHAQLAVIITGITLLGAVLFYLVVSGRIRPRPFGRLNADTKPKLKPVSLPGTTNALAKQDYHKRESAFRAWLRKKRENAQPVRNTSTAYLLPLDTTDEKRFPQRIELGSETLTLGSDGNMAKIIFNDPTISPLHAKIILDEHDNHKIFDEKSVSGVWVNYEQIGIAGVVLKHGDTVYLGRKGFRYLKKETRGLPHPVITTLENKS